MQMKEKQNVRFKMYLEVSGVMEKNVDKWTLVGELKNTYDEFVSNNDKLIELKGEHEKDIRPIINDKTKKREQLINNAVPISNVLQVFAFDKNDKGLAKTINFSRNKLNKSKDSELIDKCNTIWKAAKKLYGKSINTAEQVISNSKKSKQDAPNINGYGLTGQMIDELEEANKLFIDAILALKDAVSHRNKSAKKITEVMKDNDRLLGYKMDRLMTLFETGQKDFYKSYREARTVKYDELENAAAAKPATANVEAGEETEQKDTTKEDHAYKASDSSKPASANTKSKSTKTSTV